MERLSKRADFRRTAGGAKWVTSAFVLQARAREEADAAARTGFTATRRIGNAVARNRARRRLKEAARAVIEDQARPGHDYVMVARQGALTDPFAEILDGLGRAIHMVHRKLDAGPRGRSRPREKSAPATAT